MKAVKQIIPSFSIAFCLDFIGTDGNSTEHPIYGGHQLTEKQFRESPSEYKNALYKNIIECFENEIEYVKEGIYGGIDQPLIQSPYMKLLFKHQTRHAHILNKWIKYPELMEFAEKTCGELNKVLNKQLQKAKEVECNNMPYKSQFVLEEVILMTQENWERAV